ncbi:MAG: MBL fold metallo-hydrolase [Kangiellaceae bacterium]|nr:MBL fold metallo-hydrolase [Kangiellaceae bacterium]
MKPTLLKFELIVLFLIFTSFISLISAKENNSPYLYVLGVAQDAGYPQAGCYQKHCLPGWEDTRLRRGAVSLGLIAPNSGNKYMFEATPNFPEQLYQLEKEAPSSRFQLTGIFLTHAHIGHYAGLMFLGHEAMGASKVPVYAMPRMTTFLKDNGPWEQLVNYKNIVLMELNHNQPTRMDEIKVTPFLVPHRDEYSETVGYKIEGPNKSAIFIPDINKWTEWKTDIAALIKSVDYALLDAAFYADGELPGRDMSKIPHPFVVETMAALQGLSMRERDKVWFIHMNHTNPLLRTNSSESQRVESQGYNIAKEGIKLKL